jgi:hypothetical protein
LVALRHLILCKWATYRKQAKHSCCWFLKVRTGLYVNTQCVCVCVHFTDNSGVHRPVFVECSRKDMLCKGSNIIYFWTLIFDSPVPYKLLRCRWCKYHTVYLRGSIYDNTVENIHRLFKDISSNKDKTPATQNNSFYFVVLSDRLFWLHKWNLLRQGYKCLQVSCINMVICDPVNFCEISTNIIQTWNMEVCQ